MKRSSDERPDDAAGKPQGGQPKPGQQGQRQQDAGGGAGKDKARDGGSR